MTCVYFLKLSRTTTKIYSTSNAGDKDGLRSSGIQITLNNKQNLSYNLKVIIKLTSANPIKLTLMLVSFKSILSISLVGILNLLLLDSHVIHLAY